MDVVSVDAAENHCPRVPPAKTYSFKLDTFQEEAVGYIEKGESVLVAAHTSAGKTAVAEYAIAKSLRDGQRVIYTSPIKALSNQKFRDMQEEFKDVGLMTGDMTINPNATCLIMTTEILRSMLYRGSEVVREVAWVIYDEVHYMRDKERGVVWEESIILLPHKVRFVFLSATIPNAAEFVDWVAKMHHQPCHVVYTDYRPVPLRHFVFPAGSEGLYLVVDEMGKFREDNFQKAMSSLTADPENDVERPSKKAKVLAKTTNNASADLFKIVKLIMKNNLDPCIVFSFSKKHCETYALQMAKLDFNSSEEKELVNQVFSCAMEALSEDDRGLPQVVTILPLLKRGIGIHHGGLLPILKEVIEILFQEGLIKCLFATETFSIGINMPAKTVVFTSTRKFDGRDFRWVTSGEYIQMSGRAGRRGKDKDGIVIQMIDEKMEPDVAKGMIYGASDPLFSSYHVSYNMVLNMQRVEDADPENLLRLSFHQYQQEKKAPELERQAEELQREASTIDIKDEEVINEYHSWCKLLERCNSDIAAIIRLPDHCLPFLQPGRLLHIVENGEKDWGWGALVSIQKGDKVGNAGETKSKNNIIGGLNEMNGGDYVLEVLLDVPDRRKDSSVEEPILETSSCEIMQVNLNTVNALSAVKLTLPKDLTKESARKGVQRAMQEVKRRFQAEGGAIPALDPVKDMGICDESFTSILSKAKDLQMRIAACPFHSATDRTSRYEAYVTRSRLLEEARLLRIHARETQAVTMREDLRRMKRVLRRLGYITSDGVLCTKGRFSCELSTGDELVLTNMIFDGNFNELSIEQAVALLSCFVHKEPGKDENPKVRSDMEGAFQNLQTAARNVARVSIDAKLPLDEEEYVKSFNPALIDATFAWCSGAKFVDICRLTDIFEGSIIRTFRRLEELLRQLASASVAIGNNELKTLFEEGANRIRRGVVFAASLYL